MKKIFYLITIILLIGRIICAQPLEFKVSLEKDTFLEGEPVFLLLEVKNISSSDIAISFINNFSNFHYYLVRDNDIIKQNDKIIFTENKSYNYALKSKEIYAKVVDIGLYFGKPYFNNYEKDILYPGNYSFSASFYDYFIIDNGDTIRKSIYNSNKVSFKIRPPNKDEAILRDEFLDLKEKRKSISNEEYNRKIQKLIKNNIGNPFVSIISRNLITTNSDYEQFKSTIIAIVTSNPNSFWALYLAARLRETDYKSLLLKYEFNETHLRKILLTNQISNRERKKYNSSSKDKGKIKRIGEK